MGNLRAGWVGVTIAASWLAVHGVGVSWRVVVWTLVWGNNDDDGGGDKRQGGGIEVRRK